MMATVPRILRGPLQVPADQHSPESSGVVLCTSIFVNKNQRGFRGQPHNDRRRIETALRARKLPGAVVSGPVFCGLTSRAAH